MYNHMNVNEFPAPYCQLVVKFEGHMKRGWTPRLWAEEPHTPRRRGSLDPGTLQIEKSKQTIGLCSQCKSMMLT